MRGYARPGPRITWHDWWGRMLIRTEEDDDELLRAEDEAIAASAQPEQPPADLTALTEILADGSAAALHEAREGDRGTRG